MTYSIAVDRLAAVYTSYHKKVTMAVYAFP